MAFDVANNVSVKQYANWANSVRASQVAGQKGEGPVSNLSNVTSPLARLFKKDSVSAARQAAVDGFKKALTNAVGKTIANLAWNAIKGDVGKGKGLTAGMIRTALATTNKIMEQHMALLPPEMEASEKSQEVINQSKTVGVGGITPVLIKHQAALSALEKADQFLYKMPASKSEVENFIKEAGVVRNNLNASQLATPDNEKTLKELLYVKSRQLSSKIAEVKESKVHFPDGEESLKGLASHWSRSLIRSCARITAAAGNSTVNGALNAVIRKYTENGGKAMLDKVKSDKKKLPDNLQKELKACVKSAFNGKIPANMKKTLEGVFTESHLEDLNEGSWEPIENSFKGFVGGKAVELESDITCGRHIDESIGKQYDEGVQSYNCHTEKTANAVNLATTKLQVTDPDGQKRTVFSGVRHGVHSADKVPGMTTAAANIQRAQQTVTAAFKNYLKMHPEIEKSYSSGRPIEFPMTSISLLTPSKLKEGKMLRAQNAAWKAVNGHPMPVTVNGMSYTVTPRIQTFNYGVNKGAVSFGKFSAVTGGWVATALMNGKALNGLKGQVDEFLKNARADSKTKQAVTTLWNQILRIAVNVNEVVEGNEAYKMPARIAVLTNLMGGVPVWNCKSGKDRTGMLDVEAKFLATLIDQGQPIPEPDAKLSREQSDLLRTIAMKSGNLEMQRYNTGIAGYKLSGVNSVYERLGAGHAEKTTLKGGSGYIGS